MGMCVEHGGRLRNLQGPVQNKNVDPLLKNEEFQNHENRNLLHVGPDVAADITGP